MGSTHTQQVKAGPLRFENSPTSYSAYFDARHRDRDLEVPIETNTVSRKATAEL